MYCITIPEYIRERPTRDCCTLSQRQNRCSVVPEHPLGTPWAESGILDEPNVLHSSYPAVSSQILFTTTTYGCLHVERITACHFFYTYPNPTSNGGISWASQIALRSGSGIGSRLGNGHSVGVTDASPLRVRVRVRVGAWISQ